MSNNSFIKVLENKDENIIFAAQSLQSGNLVAFPTETVYGMGASAYLDKAIDSIYKIKNRPYSNPIIIHFAKLVDGKFSLDETLKEIEDNFIINETFLHLVKIFSPGPVSFILKKKASSKLSSLCSHEGAQAIRIPSNTVAQKLIHYSKSPIAAPSANVANKLSPTSYSHVLMSFKETTMPFLLINDDNEILGLESTVIDITNEKEPKIMRPGYITEEDIKKAGVDLYKSYSVKSASPGKGLLHYSPNAKLRLNCTSLEDSDEAILAFGEVKFNTSNLKVLNLSESANLKEAAQNLFKMLWVLDKENIKQIAVTPIPNKEVGVAINEKLIKAASK